MGCIGVAGNVDTMSLECNIARWDDSHSIFQGSCNIEPLGGMVAGADIEGLHPSNKFVPLLAGILVTLDVLPF